MVENEIYKLAVNLYIRDNYRHINWISPVNPPSAVIMGSNYWWVAQSRVALRRMREKRRKAEWERY